MTYNIEDIHTIKITCYGKTSNIVDLFIREDEDHFRCEHDSSDNSTCKFCGEFLNDEGVCPHCTGEFTLTIEDDLIEYVMSITEEEDVEIIINDDLVKDRYEKV